MYCADVSWIHKNDRVNQKGERVPSVCSIEFDAHCKITEMEKLSNGKIKSKLSKCATCRGITGSSKLNYCLHVHRNSGRGIIGSWCYFFSAVNGKKRQCSSANFSYSSDISSYPEQEQSDSSTLTPRYQSLIESAPSLSAETTVQQSTSFRGTYPIVPAVEPISKSPPASPLQKISFENIKFYDLESCQR